MRSFIPLKGLDRKSTRLNSSHTVISYAVFCLKKKKTKKKKKNKIKKKKKKNTINEQSPELIDECQIKV